MYTYLSLIVYTILLLLLLLPTKIIYFIFESMRITKILNFYIYTDIIHSYRVLIFVIIIYHLYFNFGGWSTY